MAASYPGAIKNFSAVVNGTTKLVASLFNSAYDEITAIETELGIDVAAGAATLLARLTVGLQDSGALRVIGNRGTYTGNAQTQAIAHGLAAAPKALVVVDASGEIGVWVEGMADKMNATIGSGGAVTAFSSNPVDGTNIHFVNSANFNTTNRVYYFMAFKNSSS